MERTRHEKKVVSILTGVVFVIMLTGCIGSSVPGKTSYNVDIPPDMRLCPEGQATDDNICYEGRWIENDDGSTSLQDTCGKYWDLKPERKAFMEVRNCSLRNDAVLQYHLNRNRAQLKKLQDMLEEGL